MSKLIFYLIGFLVLPILSCGQCEISGIIKYKKRNLKPVVHAKILVKKKDSILNEKYSDTNGYYCFGNLPKNEYLTLRITYGSLKYEMHKIEFDGDSIVINPILRFPPIELKKNEDDPFLFFRCGDSFKKINFKKIRFLDLDSCSLTEVPKKKDEEY